jgi:glycosyltransferase involved in cell wall biosynthesis
MKILFLAPLPPPITGQAAASQSLLDYLKQNHEVLVIDYSKRSLVNGVNSIQRYVEVMLTYWKILRFKKDVDRIYMTISQSKAGVLKDIITFILLLGRLDIVIVHSHGYGIKTVVFDKSKVIRNISKFFYRRIGSVIVLGDNFKKYFKNVLGAKNVTVVNNYADDHLFLSQQELSDKSRNSDGVLDILFLSNLIPGKGHNELLTAYLGLPVEVRSNIRLHFAGAFDNADDEEKFRKKVGTLNDVKYHGVVSGDAKASLFYMSHIFCLPTNYPYEGQPISILEAYASGCAVMTTNHAGIPDIFSDGVNGILVEAKSPSSIISAIFKVYSDRSLLRQYSYTNVAYARKEFPLSRFIIELKNIIESDLYSVEHR